MNVIPNYQPRSIPSLYIQTTLFHKDPGLGWLNTFLKIYIRALKLASDVDSSVEEKLLIGDRPKPSVSQDSGLPLIERLAIRKPEDLMELTDDEMAFLQYATELCNWLAPYHNFSRPPPAAVLAEADKQSQLRAKGINPPVSDNGIAAGVVKKSEDPPIIQEPPPSIIEYFDDMQVRFRKLLDSKARPYELLHVATLSQEALILFTIETLRFKNASLVKVNKFSGLVQSFKGIRTRALDVITEISAQLERLSETQGTIEKRKEFASDCATLEAFPEISHEHVVDVAKKTTDSCKKVLLGVAKGMHRICQTHSS